MNVNSTIDSAAVENFFSRNYYTSRDIFRKKVVENGYAVRSYLNPMLGPNGQKLTTEVALVGDSEADNLIVFVSGTHGPESFAGSGIQVYILDKLRNIELEKTAVLFVHILNPWGAAFTRRQNEDNIDLNRNFSNDFPVHIENEHYDDLHSIIHVEDLFINDARNPLIVKEIEAFIELHGSAAFQTALFQGQSKYVNGVGFSGLSQSWSNKTIREVCAEFGKNKKKVAVVDFHTGLGGFGDGLLLYPGSRQHDDFCLAKTWFGENLVVVKDDASMPYHPKGDMLTGLASSFKDTQKMLGVALEFGTFDVAQLMQVQIDDAWVNTFGAKESLLAVQTRKSLLDFFCPDSPQWRVKICMQSEQLMARLLNALN